MNSSDVLTVVLGDLHGRHDVLLRALQDLGFADSEGRWTGGARRLIQLGDVTDRGPGGLAAMDLLMDLQAEAAGAGGEVLCLIGNHEAIAMRAAAGDHAFRMNWTYNGGGTGYVEWLARQGIQGDDRDLPYAEEFYALFSPRHWYGRWLRTHRMAVRLGEYVVVHAGWSPDGPPSVAEANDIWAATPEEPAGFLAASFRPDHPLSDAAGLLWSRNQPQAEIAAACRMLGCRGLIAGHTITRGILVSGGGSLIQIDVGMVHFGTWAALGMDGDGRLWALMEGQEPRLIDGDGLIPLPTTAVPMPEEPEVPCRYPPGSLVRLYRAHDGSWVQYLLILRQTAFHGMPGYEGRWITRDERGWSWRPAHWPADRVDRYGQVAAPGEVPDELTTCE
jgi:hypothetical protein